MGKSGLVISLVGPSDSEKFLARELKSRAAAGSNFHGLFSNKRSLRKNRRAEVSSDEVYTEKGPLARAVDRDDGLVGWVDAPSRKGPEARKLSSTHS